MPKWSTEKPAIKPLLQICNIFDLVAGYDFLKGGDVSNNLTIERKLSIRVNNVKYRFRVEGWRDYAGTDNHKMRWLVYGPNNLDLLFTSFDAEVVNDKINISHCTDEITNVMLKKMKNMELFNRFYTTKKDEG